MALKGKTVTEQIWNFLKGKGLNDCGTAALMGNLYAESGLNPKNMQDSCEKKLGMTDDTYTAAVDNGTYSNFLKDSVGYGIAQWTYWSRKQNLLTYVQGKGKSIGDLETQLEFLWKELGEGYKTVLGALKTASCIRTASDIVLKKFENPKDQSTSVQLKRAEYGQIYYDEFSGKAQSTESITTEEQLRQKKVAVMQGWIGKKEADGSHRVIIDTYNSHKPLARGYAVKYTDAWCATADSAATIKAGLTDIIPIECSCSKLIELAKKKGIWVENDAYVPKPGDSILYDWDDNGTGDNTGAPEHIGVVEKVSQNTITVIEGNKDDAVGRREIRVNGKYIRGFITPDYSSKATGIKTVEEVAREVFLGKWGNGSERKKKLETAGYNYAQVQAAVNKLYK